MPIPPVICQNLWKKNRDGHWIIRHLSFEIPKGESLALVGMGGSGKTLCAKMIAGLIPPDRGKIWILGRDLNALSDKERQTIQSHIGMVFQNDALWDSLTVEENIARPLHIRGQWSHKEIHDKVSEMLERIHLLDFAHCYPRELSGGMKKRVGLARALVHNPEIVIYDHPTSGLDPQTAREIFVWMKEVQIHGVTSLVISHEWNFLESLCNPWIFL